MSGLLNTLNGSASNLPDSPTFYFSSSFSSQSGMVSSGFHHIGSLGLRNTAMNNITSGGTQQAAGNLSSGRVASNNLVYLTTVDVVTQECLLEVVWVLVETKPIVALVEVLVLFLEFYYSLLLLVIGWLYLVLACLLFWEMQGHILQAQWGALLVGSTSAELLTLVEDYLCLGFLLA